MPALFLSLRGPKARGNPQYPLGTALHENMGIEFELKYRATPEIQEQLAQTGQWRSISMETTYYDTPSKAMSSRFFTLRRRLENGVSVCTLKAPAGGDARGEWETECETIEAAIPELCKLGCPAQLPQLVGEGLQPVCGARFTRRCTLVEFGDALLELALDVGVLFGGGKQIPLCEIEVELKEGSREQAVAYGKILAARYGLEPERGSKFKRALALAEEA